jgi:hypothetical protein
MSQTKLHSLLEATHAALLAAPTAILLHKCILILAGENALNNNQDLFVVLSWVMFFLHGVAWKYIIRRIYEHYGKTLDPRNIYTKVKGKISIG